MRKHYDILNNTLRVPYFLINFLRKKITNKALTTKLDSGNK
jgi:hypothetical protein